MEFVVKIQKSFFLEGAMSKYPLGFTAGHIQAFEKLDFWRKVCRRRGFIFHGSSAPRRMLRPMKVVTCHKKIINQPYVFATGRIDIAVVHAIILGDHCNWEVHKKSRRLVLFAPIDGFHLKRGGGYIHAFPPDGFKGGHSQFVNPKHVKPRIRFKVPLKAFEMFIGMGLFKISATKEVMEARERRIRLAQGSS